jgi:hypothetical protein
VEVQYAFMHSCKYLQYICKILLVDVPLYGEMRCDASTNNLASHMIHSRSETHSNRSEMYVLVMHGVEENNTHIHIE